MLFLIDSEDISVSYMMQKMKRMSMTKWMRMSWI